MFNGIASNSDLRVHLIDDALQGDQEDSLISNSACLPCENLKENDLMDSLDVDPINNPYTVDTRRSPPQTLNSYQQVVFTSKSFYRWVLTVVLAFAVALCAYFIENIISVLCS
jgi:hypothetical protein